MESAGKRRVWIGWAAGALLMVLAGLMLFGPTGRDDVYKTLWPAKMFAQTGRVLNYNGDAVEQSSSLLHVLVLGGLHRITGLGLPDLNVFFVLAAGLGCVGMVVRLGRRLGIRDLVGLGLVTGGQSMVAYWAMGGLDAVLAAFCWLSLVDALSGIGGRWHWVVIAGSACLIAMVRPEGSMVALAGIGMATILSRLWSKRAEPVEGVPLPQEIAGRPFLLASLFLVAAAVILGCWRLWHGGNWMPQPVIAKAGGLEMDRVLDGLRYLKKETFAHPDLAILWLGGIWSLVNLVRRKRAGILSVVAWGIVAAGMTFVVASGGDWMENGRFLVPFLPLLILVVFLEIEHELRGRWRWLAKGFWLAVTAWGLWSTASGHSTGYPLLGGIDHGSWAASASGFHPVAGPSAPLAERFNRVHLRDVHPLRALKSATAEIYARKRLPVTVLSQQAGMMAYYLADEFYGKVRFIDLVGLCTRDFTDCAVTSGRGNYRGGLNMDLVYLFEDLPRIQAACGISAPDIVFGLDDAAGSLRSHVQRQGYRLVFEQDGMMPMGSGWLPGLEIESGEFVAVRMQHGN